LVERASGFRTQISPFLDFVLRRPGKVLLAALSPIPPFKAAMHVCTWAISSDRDQRTDVPPARDASSHSASGQLLRLSIRTLSCPDTIPCIVKTRIGSDSCTDSSASSQIRRQRMGSHQDLTEKLTHGVRYIFRTRGVGSNNVSWPSKARHPVLNLGTFL